MLSLYGCEHGFQSADIQKKIFKNSYLIKEYKFNSGRITYIMGYENIMIDLLIKNNISEYDILTNTDCPIIKWKDSNNVDRNHIPDIFIKSQNTII